MNDTNVGFSIVPCKKDCKCVECQIEFLSKETKQLKKEIESLLNKINHAYSIARDHKFSDPSIYSRPMTSIMNALSKF